MKKLFVGLLVGCFALSAEAQPVEVVRIYDGDTVTVNIPGWPDIIGHEIGIRIRGIDAPEIKGACEEERKLAVAAREVLSNILLAARMVELHNITRGKYFRLVADVHADGVNVADRLLVRNLARHYDGGARTSWCNQ